MNIIIRANGTDDVEITVAETVTRPTAGYSERGTSSEIMDALREAIEHAMEVA